jgi:hypothetical protein
MLDATDNHHQSVATLGRHFFCKSVGCLALLLTGLAGVASADPPRIAVKLVPVNSQGTPISHVNVNEEFGLKVSVRDLTNPPDPNPLFRGVFSTFLDVSCDESIAITDPSYPLAFDDFFAIARLGDSSIPGMIQHAGASTQFPSVALEQYLFTATFKAIHPGTVLFSTIPSAGILYEAYLFNDIQNAVHPLEFDLMTASVTVVPESTTFAFASTAALLLCRAVSRRRRRASSSAKINEQ